MGGLSGALVFHSGEALGVVVEHHPRQGTAAVQSTAFDTLLRQAEIDTKTRAVVDALGLPALTQLGWARSQQGEPLAGLVTVVDADGDLPCVEDLDPYRLGASISDYGDQGTYGQRDPYIPRTRNHVDERVSAALRADNLVLVVGPSKVGKTRTAFQAVRSGWPRARLASPDPSALSVLALHPRVRISADPLEGLRCSS
jgi:hypothetical protein